MRIKQFEIKRAVGGVLISVLLLSNILVPASVLAEDDLGPIGGGGGAGGGGGSGFGLGSLGGLLSASGVSCGGSGAGGILGSLFGGALGKVGDIFGGFLGGGGGGGLGGLLGGGGGVLGGLLGGIGGGEVPVKDNIVRNETGRIRTNTGEIVKKECVLDPIVKAITAVLLKTLGNRVVSWVQKSDIGFIKNYEMEFRKAENERADEFRRNLAKTQMGYDINSYVDNVLSYPKPGSNKLAETFTCPMSGLRDGSFNANFDNGGWAAFLKKIGTAQCNAEGATLLALEEESAQIRNKLRAQNAEISANSGFRGYGVETKEKCEPIILPSGEEHISCTTERETRTPGESIKDLMNRIFGSGIDWVINADEVTEAITAAIMFLIDTLVMTSSGSDGAGVFAPALSAPITSSPGIFSESTLMVQLNSQIARADKGIELIDALFAEALAAIIAEGKTIIALRAKAADITAKIATETDPGIIAALTAELASTNALIDSALVRLSAAKAKLAAAVSNKENILRARVDLLSLRSTLLSTTKIEDVEIIAISAINLTNALDIFFEIAGVSVVTGITETADIKIATLNQIDGTNAIGGRTVAHSDAFEAGVTALSSPSALISKVPPINLKEAELSALMASLASIRAIISAATATEIIRTTSIDAIGVMITTTAKEFEVDKLIGDAMAAFTP